MKKVLLSSPIQKENTLIMKDKIVSCDSINDTKSQKRKKWKRNRNLRQIIDINNSSLESDNLDSLDSSFSSMSSIDSLRSCSPTTTRNKLIGWRVRPKEIHN